MAREFARVQDYYVHMHHDIQPPVPRYHHQHQFDLTHTNVAPYELTNGSGVGVGVNVSSACLQAGLMSAHVPLQHQPMQTVHHEVRKRKTHHFSDGYVSNYETQLPTPTAHSHTSYRKRKTTSFTGSGYEDDTTDDTRSTRTAPDKKQNHSEIEKRRRDKMNTYIAELSSMVPMCGALARKLDKLTVLRMAVQHLRSVRGAQAAGPLTARPRPAHLSERELAALVLHAARDCALLVVGCDRGRLLYVSRTATDMLNYHQSELLGQSLFDILHPKDVGKVKEQLSSSDLSPRERLIDAKTMLPVKADVVADATRLCPGARRSFFCRIKCRLNTQQQQQQQQQQPQQQQQQQQQQPSCSATLIKEEAESCAKMRKKNNDKKYCIVQCTGYLKSWAPVEGGVCEETGEEGGGSPSCLVAVARALPSLTPTVRAHAPHTPPTRRLHYVSRHATDGKFLFVDQRVTVALGFVPQELLGTSLYEYVCGAQLGAVARTHKAALLRRTALRSPAYRFRRKDGTYARIQTHFKPFRNPWTKDVECLVANNAVLADEPAEPADELGCDLFAKHGGACGACGACGSCSAGGECNARGEAAARAAADAELQRLIESQVESHKIGATIAEEALRRTSPGFSPDLPAELLHDAVFGHQNPMVDTILGAEAAAFSNQVRNNVTLSAAGGESPPSEEVAETAGAGPAATAATASGGAGDGGGGSNTPPASPPLPPAGFDGNGEAAMAVIMSLLEADAGLGGLVNFSGLPWPLP